MAVAGAARQLEYWQKKEQDSWKTAEEGAI